MFIGIDDLRSDNIREFSIVMFNNKKSINNILNSEFFIKLKSKCPHKKFKSKYILKHIKDKGLFSKEDIKKLVKLILKNTQKAYIIKFPAEQHNYHKSKLDFYKRWSLLRDIILIKKGIFKLPNEKHVINICQYQKGNMMFIRRILIAEFARYKLITPKINILHENSECQKELIELADLFKCVIKFDSTYIIRVNNNEIISGVKDLIKSHKLSKKSVKDSLPKHLLP